MDMAVGIIIGAAFTAIVGSLVADLINPIISLFMGGIDFSGMYALLGDGEYTSIGAAEEAGAAVFAYGRFIMAIINFLIIAFVVFMLGKSCEQDEKSRRSSTRGAKRPNTRRAAWQTSWRL